MVPKPCIIQQYYNHDTILYKAYVIDEDVMVYRRPSLPNLSFPSNYENIILSQRKYSLKLHSLAFDSRYSYPKLENFLKESIHVPDSPKLWSKNPNHPLSQEKKNSSPTLFALCNDDNEHKKRKLLKNLEKNLVTASSLVETSTVLNLSSELTSDDELYGKFYFFLRSIINFFY
jgi:hypothetical protein